MKNTGLQIIFVVILLFGFFKAKSNILFSIDYSYGINDSLPDYFKVRPFSLKPSLNSEQYRYPYFGMPKNLKSSVKYNPNTGEYEVKYLLGDLEIGEPAYLDYMQYKSFEMTRNNQLYWMNAARMGRNGVSLNPLDRFLNPQLNVGIEGFDRIFGSNTIDIRPNGSAELIFGLNYSNSGDPSLPKRLQKQTQFDFDMKIQLGVTGQIGDKMKVGINYNTEATFDFENQAKLAYTGSEDEIIQSIEAGNVSFPLNSSLISGSHSLFGIKSALKFGNLSVTSVISKQEGKSKVIDLEGGAQQNEFEISASEYEANRHFFLAHYFRENYDRALASLPIINSGISITRIEVWVTNKTGNFENSRNILALLDLGENQSNIFSALFSQSMAEPYPQDSINTLLPIILGNFPQVRNINQAAAALKSLEPAFVIGRDFEKVENARKLSPNEFTYNPKLGYISLNFALNADEVLAVAYEYTLAGEVFRVGEFSNSGVDAPNTLMLKLLKGTTLTPSIPNWKLMMKNIYSIGAFQINPDNFQLHILYQNDNTGNAINYIPEGDINGQVLLQVLGLDKLNSQLDPGSDGYFDFIDKITIDAAKGKIIFSQLEPFGSYLKSKFSQSDVADKYIYQELYDSTQSKAKQIAEKNKFTLKGRYKSSTGSEIYLNAMNIPTGSVKVSAGGIQLQEGTDYVVDYLLGRVTILNQGLMESGTPMRISLESNELYNFETKTLLGTHLDYQFSDNFNLGATIMNLTEKPMTNKVDIGDEPVSNTIWGLNGAYSTEAPFLTRLVDFLPFIETKEMSNFSVNGEFAHLIPGHSKAIEKNGISYIDDFEGTKITSDLKAPNAWTIASIPQGQPDLFPEASLINNLANGYNRAKFAWYIISSDLLSSNIAPEHLQKDLAQRSNHLVREVIEQEIFPYRESQNNIPTPLAVLNLAYYPQEKGPYNFDVNPMPGISSGMGANGRLLKPQTRWGGIMRNIQTNDFEAANIEYIEFWMMDPFVYDTLAEGGDFYINLGNISEDILKDSRKSFENGLPPGQDVEKVDTTVWGRVPQGQSLVNAFDNNNASRVYQDVGLDGLRDEDEQSFYEIYLQQIASIYGTNSEAYQSASPDPSADNYHYYLGADFDQQQLSILERYKLYNGMDGNSPTNEQSPEDYPTSGSLVPDIEDINLDNTLSETESYFQYKISLRPEDMEIGQNFITDMIVNYKERVDGNVTSVKWYQFKVPIYNPQKVVGTIEDFKSIRFVRLFMRGWDEQVVLRLAQFDLVRGDWRKYNLTLSQGGEVLSDDNNFSGEFDVSAVNIEENGNKTPVNYVLPPGIRRENDPTNPYLPLQNEQALVLKAVDLPDGEAKATYKNVMLDARQYKKLQMDIHAEALPDRIISDYDLVAFIRIGSDFQQNYYEYEVPLKLTPTGIYNGNLDADRLSVWPEENKMIINFELLQQAKQARNEEVRNINSTVRLTAPYEYRDGKNTIRIMGNPNLSNIKTIMIGIRNPEQASNTLKDDGFSKSVEIWVNELRLTDFIENGGWAATAHATAQLADFANVSVAGNTSTRGFGSIEKKVNERSKEDVYQYDISSNLELGKFFPEKASVKIPMFVSFSEGVKIPQFNPLDPDIELKATLDNADNKQQRDSIKYITQDYTRRRSVNFTNVKINKQSQNPHFYDISNLSTSYGFNEILQRDINTEYNLTKNYTGAIQYNFNNRPKTWQPFQKSKIFKAKSLRIIKDFNLNFAPTSVSFRTLMNRNYNEMQTRNIDNPGILINPNFKKDFTWAREYDVKYNISRGLRFDFTANNLARIDEPDGRINKNENDYELKRDSIINNIKDWGRTTQYLHRFSLNYTLPINKLPMLDWVNATAKYTGTYNWDASPILSDTMLFGNTIKNGNDQQLNTSFNLFSLYTKVPYLKKLSQEMTSKRSGKLKPEMIELTFSRKNLVFKAEQFMIINHKLNTLDVAVKATDEQGRVVKGIMEVVDKNSLRFKLPHDYNNISIEVTGKIPAKPKVGEWIFKNSVYAIMGLRNVSINYSAKQASAIPGYLPSTKMLGMESVNNVFAPGALFVLGWQDRTFPELAASNQWLSSDSLLNQAVSFTDNQTISFRALAEPLVGLKINFTAERSLANQVTEYWQPDANGNFVSKNRMVGGNFKMTVNMLATAFWGLDENTYSSKAYENFRNNREVVAWRLSNERNSAGISTYNPYSPNVNQQTGEEISDGYPNGYGPLTQDVLIPAFLAAYTNKQASNVALNAFKFLPGLNWNLTYEGLSQHPFFKSFMKNLTLRHAYMASFNINSFTSNPSFDYLAFEQDGFSFVRDNLVGYFIPENEFSAISMEEKLNPLFGIDMQLKNSFTGKFELRRSRMISLSLANKQIEESERKEIVVGLGYRFDKLPINIKTGGGVKRFESDMNINADFSFRDDITIYRKIQENTSDLYAGMKNMAIQLSADYMLSSRFQLRIFYDQTVSDPRKDLSYRTSNAKFGISVKVSLIP